MPRCDDCLIGIYKQNAAIYLWYDKLFAIGSLFIHSSQVIPHVDLSVPSCVANANSNASLLIVDLLASL